MIDPTTKMTALEDIVRTIGSPIDAHIHLNGANRHLADLAEKIGLRFLTVNTDYPDFFPSIDVQEEVALQAIQDYPGTVSYAATFSMDGWEDTEQWQPRTMDKIKASIANGAKAVKVWKNIGMSVKDNVLKNSDHWLGRLYQKLSGDRYRIVKRGIELTAGTLYRDNRCGKFIMISDPRFDPIFAYLADAGIPVIGHIGEPLNCWLPLEEMTTLCDREYFEAQSTYHMHLRPENPTHEQLIDARDERLRKNPDLIFVAAHLASLEHSIDELGRRLDEFPNMYVDLAGRVCHLQVQSQKNRDAVREFMQKYQDRIIYGTDIFIDGTENAEELRNKIETRWINDWNYLATGNTMVVHELHGSFQGLCLPEEVLVKIYRTHAERVYGLNPAPQPL